MVDNRMKRRVFLQQLSLVCLLSSSPWAAAAPTTVISGYVRVGSEDSKGNITSLEIISGEEENSGEPYLIVDKGKGSELKKHVGQWVIAAGVILEDALGWKSIEVKSYTLVEDLQEK